MAIDWNEVATIFCCDRGRKVEGVQDLKSNIPFFRCPIVDSYATLNNTFKSKPIKVVKNVYFIVF